MMRDKSGRIWLDTGERSFSWKNKAVRQSILFQVARGLFGQKPRLPKNLPEAVSEGNFSSTFWAKPQPRYPLQPQYIVLFD
jgi:hypothetical protein